MATDQNRKSASFVTFLRCWFIVVVVFVDRFFCLSIFDPSPLSTESCDEERIIGAPAVEAVDVVVECIVFVGEY